MKKIFIIALFAFISFSTYAQDSIKTPRMLLRPYVETGVDFIRNAKLKEFYNTQSKLFWSGGIQVGHPETQKLIPYMQFTYSSFEVERELGPNNKYEFVFTTKQFSGGFLIPFKRIDNVYLRARLGYSYSLIKESFNRIDSNSQGLQIGFGAERKLIGYSRVYIELAYSYQKTGKSNFRDYDMAKIAVGFVLW